MYKIYLLILSFFCLTESFACLNKLNYSLKEKSIQDKIKILKKLKKKDMACIFKESSSLKKPQFEFFLPQKKRRSKRVQKFYGVNSFPIFKTFEKHFFYIDTPDGQQIFGYNKSKIQWLGGPGFFALKKDDRSGDLLVDYRPDFKSLIPKEEFNSWRGRKVHKIKNNKRSLIYGGGLVDRLHTINDSMVIGQGIMKTKVLKKTKIMGYFILIKK